MLRNKPSQNSGGADGLVVVKPRLTTEHA